jgi:hypothetical protein
MSTVSIGTAWPYKYPVWAVNLYLLDSLKAGSVPVRNSF